MDQDGVLMNGKYFWNFKANSHNNRYVLNWLVEAVSTLQLVKREVRSFEVVPTTRHWSQPGEPESPSSVLYGKHIRDIGWLFCNNQRWSVISSANKKYLSCGSFFENEDTKRVSMKSQFIRHDQLGCKYVIATLLCMLNVSTIKCREFPPRNMTDFKWISEFFYMHKK